MYDNAKANAVMQQAIAILSIEEGMNQKRKTKFRTFIHETCSPEVAFYDDDTTGIDDQDLKKVTIQIKVSKFTKSLIIDYIGYHASWSKCHLSCVKCYIRDV